MQEPCPLPRPTMRTTFVMIWTLVLLQAPALPSAQSGGEKKNPLAGITMLKCSFPVAVSGSWKDWTPKAEMQSGPALTLVIDEIDIDGGTARIGTTHTTALLTQTSVHFMERNMGGSRRRRAAPAEQRSLHGANDGGEPDDDDRAGAEES